MGGVAGDLIELHGHTGNARFEVYPTALSSGACATTVSHFNSMA